MNEKPLFWWGIDGCPSGWVCVGLSANGEYDCFVRPDICAVNQHLQEKGATIALIDMPIGLSDNKDERKCDKEARKYVYPRDRSVFRVPCRQAIEAYRAAEDPSLNSQKNRIIKQKAGKETNRKITGDPLEDPSWNIVPKIVQVDCFLNCETEQFKVKRRELFREVHPEVCFRAFNGKGLEYAKKPPREKLKRQEWLGLEEWLGLTERLDILEKHFPGARQAYEYCHDKTKGKNVAKDDILDAMVAALTAKIGFREDGSELETLGTLPPNPPKDSCGLPMEMLYVELQSLTL